MDAVVLAAGKGSRLSGVVPAYFKPMIVIDGMPLVRKIIEQIRTVQVPVDRILVVANPVNAHMIHECVSDLEVNVVLQNDSEFRGTGPGLALRQALQLVRTEHVMVVMADNVISTDTFKQVEGRHRASISGEQRPEVVCTRLVTRDEAARFTRWDASCQVWTEGTEFNESEEVEPGLHEVWIGPIIIHREKMLGKLWSARGEEFASGEIPISDFLSDEAVRVRGEAHDIGTPSGLFFSKSESVMTCE